MIILDIPHFQTVVEYPLNLPSGFCKRLIKRFEEDDRRLPGITLDRKKDTKESLDLDIATEIDWSEEVSALSDHLLNVIQPYLIRYHRITRSEPLQEPTSFDAFQIQRTDPGSIGFRWHSDANARFDQIEGQKVLMSRRLTYIWYLNDDFDEGETEFADFKIKPETGKLLLFPAEFSYIHRGIPPKNGSKYILTGWMSQSIMVKGFTQSNAR
jgi:hypothetical protein